MPGGQDAVVHTVITSILLICAAPVLKKVPTVHANLVEVLLPVQVFLLLHRLHRLHRLTRLIRLSSISAQRQVASGPLALEPTAFIVFPKHEQLPLDITPQQLARTEDVVGEHGAHMRALLAMVLRSPHDESASGRRASGRHASGRHASRQGDDADAGRRRCYSSSSTTSAIISAITSASRQWWDGSHHALCTSAYVRHWNLEVI